MLSGPLKSSRKYEPMTQENGLNTSLKHEAIDGRALPGVGLAALLDLTRENSPGQDAARIHRLIALSSFSVWWCMAVLS